MYKKDKNMLIYQSEEEHLYIEAWGEDSLRVTSFPHPENKVSINNALINNNKVNDVEIEINGKKAQIINGKIKAELENGKLTFYNKDIKILEDYVREQSNIRRTIGIDEDREVEKKYSSSLNIMPRVYNSITQGDYEVIQRFEGNPDAQIFGMGQYQENTLDLNNMTLELAQRNSQSTIPFYVSSEMYGFLWNNPAIGKVNFSKNIIEWTNKSTTYVDYWITVGDNYKQIHKNYADATGHAPKINEDLLGLWQSKLRYQSRQESEIVLKKYKKLGIDLSVFVIDYFHWTAQGDFKFDEKYWPEMETFIEELQDDNTKVMVSVWPTVAEDSENFSDYKNEGMLIQTNSGSGHIFGNTYITDMTNKKTRDYVWKKIENNYLSKGRVMFWADQAEPEFDKYDFSNLRYSIGKGQNISSLYPDYYAKMFADGRTESKEDRVDPTLIRSAWAGSQKHGILLWSGDIDSSFKSFEIQIKAGINVGMAGIPYWTADIGGFHGGDPSDHEFRELLVRWFQYATFSPILRMHGDRQPHTQRIGDSGGGVRTSGAANEIWSFGKEVQDILIKYIELREKLKPYILRTLDDARNYGYTTMRPLAYMYPNDQQAIKIAEGYMFGDDIIVYPVTEYKRRNLDVYLPCAETVWIDIITGKEYKGGNTYQIAVPLDIIPAFYKKNSNVI